MLEAYDEYDTDGPSKKSFVKKVRNLKNIKQSSEKISNIENTLNQTEKRFSSRKFGTVDLLKLLREKGSVALDILTRANKILNNKLDHVYKLSVKELHNRHIQENQNLEIKFQTKIEESTDKVAI